MVFFRKYLGEAVAAESSKPMKVPQMLTIDDFFVSCAGMEKADRVTLLLELYTCYKELNPKAESLDEFIFWGDVILADFNDVDKYLVEPEQIFRNIADFRSMQDDYSYLSDTQREAIETFVNHFNDRSGCLTVDLGSDNPNVKARFLQIWNILYPLYEAFNDALKKKGLAYDGMIYRHLATRLKTEPVSDVFGDQTYVFVGLNALNECEKTVLGKLKDASMAEFCWDYSTDMIKDERNRSSVFMSENILDFPQAARWDAEGLNIPEINVVSVSSSVGQVKRVGSLLSESEHCAVVLPDEGLLMPLLNSIPEEITKVNVTMGYPMKASGFYSLMSDISSMQVHTIKRKGEWYFYHKQVWSVFSSPLFRKVMSEKDEEIVAKIKAEAKYYIPQSDFAGTSLMETTFRPVINDHKEASLDQTRAFAEYQTEFVSYLGSLMVQCQGMEVELEFAKEYFKCVNSLKRVLDQPVLPMTYIHILDHLVSGQNVPFRGEPLEGLQVMGPLEMRALDFRNLIILSANEGMFPRKSVSSSFIPPQLRKGFGLPTYEYQDAVWAYYFYRMISRAEKVWIFYDSRTEGLKSGEESRYIKQLEYHFNLPINRYVVKLEGFTSDDSDELTKTQEDIDAIKSMALSATALQNYLACPAKFYYNNLKSLRAEDEVVESLDAGMFGTIYHNTMWALYSNPDLMKEDAPTSSDKEAAAVPKMKSVTRAYIRGWIGREEDIKRKVRALILNKLNAVEIEGRNLVVEDVIRRYVVKTLQRDLELLEKEGIDAFEIIGMEQNVKGVFKGQKFKGYIDRLDSLRKGEIRVVDYKTGKVLDKDEDIQDGNAESIADQIFDPSTKQADRPKIALQFFIYDMLLSSRKETIYNSVYSTSKLFKAEVKTVQKNEVFYKAMCERLEKLLDEMYDPQVHFRKTEDKDTCKYCDFKMICGR